jgi:hypothetical protein
MTAARSLLDSYPNNYEDAEQPFWKIRVENCVARSVGEHG